MPMPPSALNLIKAFYLAADKGLYKLSGDFFNIHPFTPSYFKGGDIYPSLNNKGRLGGDIFFSKLINKPGRK